MPEGRHPYIGQLSTDAACATLAENNETRTKIEDIALSAMTEGILASDRDLVDQRVIKISLLLSVPYFKEIFEVYHS